MAGSGFRRRHRGDYDRDPKRRRPHREHSPVSPTVPRGHPVLRRIGDASCRQGRHRDVRLGTPIRQGERHLRNDTHLTAPTRFIEANGVRYAYRRLGPEEGTPLVFLSHFRAGLDNWDPAVTDGLASGRPVILFNNAGVASSSGEPANTIDASADHVARFVRALGLQAVDVLAFSIGGYVAQSVILRHPDLVRRLVLVGTAPRNGELATDPRIPGVAGDPVPTLEDFLFLFFTPSPATQAPAKAFWQPHHKHKAPNPPSCRAPR